MYFDTHAHLDQQEFDADRGEVIARARAAGVETILCVAVSAESSRAVLQLAEQYELFAAVGIHPNSRPRPRRAIGTGGWPWSAIPASWPSAKRAWTATGISRRSRSSRSTSTAICGWRRSATCR